MNEQFNCFMPISKAPEGGFIGILSDTSIDRDGELMAKELLQEWAGDPSPLPMLANHENKMEKFIGGWTNKKLISKGNRHALSAQPFFFSKEANPLSHQIQTLVEEATEKGLDVGISIGAIPKESKEQDIEGKRHKVYTKAEIVEATIVPIQSNRYASFQRIAKEFDIVNKEIKEEVIKMTEEVTIEKADDKMQECIKGHMKNGKSKEEATSMCKLSLVEVKKEDNTEILQKQLQDMKKELEEIKKLSVLQNAPTVEKAIVLDNNLTDNLTIEKMLSLRYGGR